MNRQMMMKRLLAFFIAVGVILSPLSMPFSSMAMSAQAMAATESMEMASDMPCCPKAAPSPFDCQKCLLATCMVKYSSPTLTISVGEVATLGSAIPLGNDVLPAGLRAPPPDQPPRTLI